ncbi:MAG: tubulin-like doman-containing protein [Fuerstiella sp.]
MPTETEQAINTELVSNTEMLQAEDAATVVPSLGGTQMADYQLTERLGSGGYGEVWRAMGPGGLPKAVKVLYGERDGAHAEAELKALERMRELRHPFLLNIERIEVVNGRLIVVTELADGNLSQRFETCQNKGEAGIPRDELLGFLKDVADALDFMSEKHGLQHLDIKPDNILLQGDHAKVGDFGLAKDLNVTNVSVLNGFTPTFAAPELFEGRPGRATDQYSLAIVYQLMLTGQLPFNGRTAAQLTAQHLRSKPDLVSLQPVDRPVIARALSKNPHSRFDSCRQFIDELAKRRHSRTSNRLPALQEPQEELLRTALLKAEGCNDSRTLARKASVPASHTAVPTDGSSARRTAFVGVGGLAGNVLRHLKTMLGRQSCPSTFPILQIDTDRQALTALKAVGDVPGLAADETLPIPLRTSREYRSSAGSDLSWLSRRWLFNIPRSGQVEGIRPLGRLALCDHRHTVSARLQSLLEQAQEPADEIAGMPVSAGLDVYVVASTCGGTSSGALADLGLMIRQAARQQSLGDVRILGILLHGTGAMRNVTDVQEANTVCVLQELAHLSTPGLETRRGFDKAMETTDAIPFDHNYLIHLGDGLGHQGFMDEAAQVATFLFDSAATAAHLDFRSWRDSREEEPGLRLRMLGICRQDATSFQTAATESGNLCSLMLRRWCADASPRDHSEGQPLPVELTDTQTLLEDLKLTQDTLPQQVRALLKGECGREIETLTSGVFTELTKQCDLSRCTRRQILDHLDAAVAAGQTATADTGAFDQIVSELQASLSAITLRCQQSLQKHLTDLLDTPHRLKGAAAATSYVAAALADTAGICHQLLTDIESTFTALTQKGAVDLPLDIADAGSTEEAGRRLCREYCVLTAYQAIYRCFSGHVTAVSNSVDGFTAKLQALHRMLESISLQIASPIPAAGSVPPPIVDAFDRHLRTVQPGMLANFLECGDASELARQLSGTATQFLMAASAADGGSNVADDHTTEFPGNAWPRFRGAGGRRRVLGLVPSGIDRVEIEKTLKQEFDDCVATRTAEGHHLSVVCEVEGVPVEAILDRLTHGNPHIAEVASRLHTRIDVDW